MFIVEIGLDARLLLNPFVQAESSLTLHRGGGLPLQIIQVNIS